MWYVIYAREAEGGLAARKAVRPAHLERANALAAEGRILLAGPMPAVDSPDPGPAGFDGSLMVVEFDSLDEAREWAESDPYVTGGAWESVEVKPFLQVLP